jgi:hypothetical protein
MEEQEQVEVVLNSVEVSVQDNVEEEFEISEEV